MCCWQVMRRPKWLTLEWRSWAIKMLLQLHISSLWPGTDVYGGPEAIKSNSVYTDKIDCFSFGVTTLQIVTQQFPCPGNHRKEITINQPGVQQIIEVTVSEIEWWQNHIAEIDPSHPLLPVVLDCLKDTDFERPTAHNLCERIAGLKEIHSTDWVKQQSRVEVMKN